MRFRNAEQIGQEKITLQMTPMIDIVFQILVFFIMSFKIVTLEGDFNIKMPLAAPAQSPIDDVLPPLRVRLIADAEGQLAGIQFGERALSGFEELTEEILAIIGPETDVGSLAESAEVELDVDYNLRYEYVVEAITAVSGRQEGDEIVRMIEKIKFAPPREAVEEE